MSISKETETSRSDLSRIQSGMRFKFSWSFDKDLFGQFGDDSKQIIYHCTGIFLSEKCKKDKIEEMLGNFFDKKNAEFY